MPRPMAVSFLGTSSGGGPTEHRSCSSLVLDLSSGQELWMVDCAEGTLRQFHHQQLGLKPGKVRNIFITHLHMDHCMGIPTFLGNLLRQGQPDPTAKARYAKIELYGPAGLRILIRTILTMTSAVLNESYAVHELLTPTDLTTSCEPNDLHSGEVKGRDIRCGKDGLWMAILNSRFGRVDAGPIEHRAPCLGYVFTTPQGTSVPRRKVVILGDTSDPSPIAPIAMDADILVHEATDASIPTSVDAKAKEHKRTPAFVETHAKERGHSTPGMAGEFAKAIRAKKLVLNHVGARFPPAGGSSARGARIIMEIERQAVVASGLPFYAVQAAYDFLLVAVGPVAGPSERETSCSQTDGVSSDGKRRRDDSEQNHAQHWKRAKR